MLDCLLQIDWMQEQVQKQVQVPMEVASQQMQELYLLIVPLDQRLMSGRLQKQRVMSYVTYLKIIPKERKRF